jgi:D-glycero-D-manno-heptose 1,7-bisphosphate phosphatase
MNRALFLDRDGVLDELVFYPDTGEWAAPRRLEDVRLVEGAADAARRAHAAGWLLVIVTNQPDFAKGKSTLDDLRAVHDAVVGDLSIAKSCVCHHHPNAVVAELRIVCECRKPGALSLRNAARELDIDLAQSWMIGDQDADLRAGRAAGCRVALIEGPHLRAVENPVEPDLRVASLAEFVARVVENRAP